MKKLFDNLPFRLLLGIIIGVILGQVFPESVMKVVVTLQYIMGQLITFCVPSSSSASSPRLSPSWVRTLPACWAWQSSSLTFPLSAQPS